MEKNVQKPINTMFAELSNNASYTVLFALYIFHYSLRS